MLTLTSPVETPLHRLPAGAKLAGLCLFTLVLFRTTGLVSMALALTGVAGVAAIGGPTFLRHSVRMLLPLWPFAAVLVLWHLWQGNLSAGAVILLRLTAAVGAANLVTMTTRLSDMLAVLLWLGRPLARMGLPSRALALALALSIRFIPVLSDRLIQIREAWRARSPRRPGWRILMPAVLAALDDADHVAEALRARGGMG